MNASLVAVIPHPVRNYLIDEDDELLACAMQVCDYHGDSDAARDAMRTDVLALAPHLRADLLAHFQQAYQL